jgi:MFS family permease
MGMAMPINTAIRARFFGRKAMGTIIGTSMMFLTPVGVVAPIYAGWMYDTTGSYQTAFIIFTVLLYASAVMLLFLHPPKAPDVVTDIHNFT